MFVFLCTCVKNCREILTAVGPQREELLDDDLGNGAVGNDVKNCRRGKNTDIGIGVKEDVLFVADPADQHVVALEKVAFDGAGHGGVVLFGALEGDDVAVIGDLGGAGTADILKKFADGDAFADEADLHGAGAVGAGLVIGFHNAAVNLGELVFFTVGAGVFRNVGAFDLKGPGHGIKVDGRCLLGSNNVRGLGRAGKEHDG